MYTLTTHERVFAGQRAEAFFVDLGSIFDLGDLRPLSPDQLIPGGGSIGINTIADKNVHSLVLQIPVTSLTSNNVLPTGPTDPHAVIGVYTTASRKAIRNYTQPAPSPSPTQVPTCRSLASAAPW